MKLLSALLAFAVLNSIQARAAIPPDQDISGLYSFVHDGESIQLNLQDGRLSGWVTTFGFLESDKDTLLDRFFKEASIQSSRIHFITRPLHGCWVEFSGTIERGDVSSRAKEGYFRLTGTVMEYQTDAEYHQSVKQREAVFKSAADPSAAALH